jgi:N-acetylglucosamine kinase-like BadF-type ATPase
MIDGVSGKTVLASMLADEFGLRSQEEIIKAVYKDGFDLAAVAPLVIRAAQNRDRMAVEILGKAAFEIVEMIRAVISPLKQYTGRTRAKIPLVFVGSLLDSDNIYSAKVRALIRKELKSILIEKPIESPARGAVLMALARMRKGAQKTARATVD